MGEIKFYVLSIVRSSLLTSAFLRYGSSYDSESRTWVKIKECLNQIFGWFSLDFLLPFFVKYSFLICKSLNKLLFSHYVLSDSFVTPWTVAHQASLPMGFPRQEYWSGLPFPSPGDLPDPGIEPRYPVWQVDALPLSYQENSLNKLSIYNLCVLGE